MARVIQYRLDGSAPMPAVTTPALMMQGDNLADSIRVQLVGETLTGYTATYYLEREDGVRVPVDGTIDGDTVKITLTEPCYRVPGSYNGLLRISNAETGERRTILRMSGRIVSEGAGPILDEESVIPSVEDIIAQLEAMEKAIEATEAAIETAEAAAENADNAAGYAVETTDKAVADLQAQVNSGAFDGRGFTILGYYATLDDLISAVPYPARGDAYGVGTESPYDIYVWDEINGMWINNGSISAADTYEILSMSASSYVALTVAEKAELYAQGVRIIAVEDDEDGELPALTAGYYVPRVDDDGLLTWEPTDASMPAVASVNIRGPQGNAGADGSDGVGIKSVEQTTTSVEDGGTNVLTVTMSDNSTATFSVRNGSKGSTGGTGPAGVDGVSATHSWSGTTLTITSASGTSSADLQGPQGETGPQGDTGVRGSSVLRVTTAPSSYTTATGGFTPTYRIALSTVKTQSEATEVLVGDTLLYNYYTYPIGYVDSSYVYLGARASIRGATGAAGSTPVKGTDYFTAEDQADMVAQVKALLTSELWTFTLDDGTTVEKEVYIDE